VEETIKKIICEKFNLKEVDEDSHLDDLSEDSFGKIELLFAIEEATGKKLSEGEILQIETFKDLLDIIRKK